MISIDDALAAYDALAPLPAEPVSLLDALGRVTAADAVSASDLPPFPQSSMDGYAVRADALALASEDAPVSLPVSDTIGAGPVASAPSLAPGTCARIFTGGHVPTGATAIVMQEHVRRDGDHAVFTRATDAGAWVRQQAEECQQGAPLVSLGQVVDAGAIGALAAGGVATVSVRRTPKVALLVTGDELAQPGEPLRVGQVYDANSSMVLAWLRGRGVEAQHVAVKDTADATARAIGQACGWADVVITTGGVSVGDKDFVMDAARANGIEDVFWKVAQKPGKPLYFGRGNGTALIGLPGNPAAVFVGLHVHVARLLDRLEGRNALSPRWAHATLTHAVRAPETRTLWYRCMLHYDGATALLAPLGGQASHMISNLAAANAIARIPAGESCNAGDVVSFVPVA